MPIYKLTRGTHYENGKRLKAGDTIPMTEERFAAGKLGDRFVLVGGGEGPVLETGTVPVPGTGAGTVPVTALDVEDILSKNVPEILTLLPSLNDQQLNELYDAETAGQNRKTLVTAIAKRHEELTAEVEK